MGPREGGLGRGLGEGLGMQWETIRLGPGYKARPGPVRVEWGRVGPSRAEWGWGGVGHALVDRPSGGAWGRVGPSRAE